MTKGEALKWLDERESYLRCIRFATYEDQYHYEMVKALRAVLTVEPLGTDEKRQRMGCDSTSSYFHNAGIEAVQQAALDALGGE